MKSVMQKNFASVPKVKLPRSSFNRSCGYKTAFNSGYLVPFFVDEAYPGDTFKMRLNHITRLTTPIVPIMDNIYLETFFFAVPHRLVWDHWQNFCGERDSPDDTTEYVIPQVVSPDGGFGFESIFDYMGVPPNIGNVSVNALIPRCYNLIYNEWFRDENLIDPVPVNKGDGPDDVTHYKLLRRGKRFDYVTSCLPWPQKGPGVEIGLAGTASVRGNGMSLGLTDGTSFGGLYDQSSSSTSYVNTSMDFYGQPVGTSLTSSGGLSTAKSLGVTEDGTQSGLVADLSSTQVVTINALRQAFAVQHLLEVDARGTRYGEILRNHFGVISPDQRLQRPEFLGSSSTKIHTYPVAQTSSSDGTTPQGNLSAYGVGSGDNSVVIDKSFVEHCYVIGLVNVRADLTYQQGLDRMWSKKTRFEFYWPALAHLGEQAVLNKEIYLQGNDQDDEVFGYQERFAELRYKASQITGKMRSSHPQSLDVWHLSQNFESLPVLNQSFIEDNPPLDRVLAVQDEPQLQSDIYLEYYCYRPVPLYGTPGLGSHF